MDEIDEFEKLKLNIIEEGSDVAEIDVFEVEKIIDKAIPKLKAQILRENPLAGLSDEEKDELKCILYSIRPNLSLESSRRKLCTKVAEMIEKQLSNTACPSDSRAPSEAEGERLKDNITKTDENDISKDNIGEEIGSKAKQTVPEDSIKTIKAVFEKYFGKRCSEVKIHCYSCMAWDVFDTIESCMKDEGEEIGSETGVEKQ